FHPAMWWLMAQSRLAREQIVDAAVVSITAARKDYIASLLAIAGTRLESVLSPASPFLRKRHLIHRIHSLLEEVSMSKPRLVFSYLAIVAVLVGAARVVVLAFPLAGQAQVVEPTPPVAPVAAAGLQNPPP